MKKVLLIKLTSLGDLIHALPAISDASVYAGITLDWLIDENFKEVATWHDAVTRVITANHRKWRKDYLQLSTYSSIKSTLQNLRLQKYDLIIDGQGNFKSALLAACGHGLRVGFDAESVREWIAHFAYQKQCSASKRLHAVDRLRLLFSQALNYPLPQNEPHFAINTSRFIKSNLDLPKPYLVFVHSASWETKLWPELYWKELIAKATQQGFHIVLPWGNLQEYERAKRLAISPHVTVLPKMNLSEIGYIISQAKACVCVDTGLSHLAAALNVPSITIYGATDSGLIGANGKNQLHVVSTIACSPCNKKQCQWPKASLYPPCLGQISPEGIFRKILSMF